MIDATDLRRPCAPTDTLDEEHKHQCPSCDTTWAHTNYLNALGATRQEYELAHTCPQCGERQYFKLMDEGERGKANRTREDLVSALARALFVIFEKEMEDD